MSYGVEQLGPRASKTKEQPKAPDDVKNVRAVASPPRPSGHVCSAAAGAGSFPDRRDERRQGIVLTGRWLHLSPRGRCRSGTQCFQAPPWE